MLLENAAKDLLLPRLPPDSLAGERSPEKMGPETCLPGHRAAGSATPRLRWRRPRQDSSANTNSYRTEETWQFCGSLARNVGAFCSDLKAIAAGQKVREATVFHTQHVATPRVRAHTGRCSVVFPGRVARRSVVFPGHVACRFAVVRGRSVRFSSVSHRRVARKSVVFGHEVVLLSLLTVDYCHHVGVF